MSSSSTHKKSSSSAPIVFAYVRFLVDNVRTTVDVDSIKHFNPKDRNDFLPRQAYMVKWQNKGESDEEYGLYKAQILALGGSQEEIMEALSYRRLKVPKVYDTSVELSSDDGVDGDDDEEDKGVKDISPVETITTVAQQKKAQKTSREVSHVERLKGIVSEKLQSRKQLFPSLSPSPSSSSSSNSDKLQISQLKRKSEATEVELHSALKENKKLRTLNISYQERFFRQEGQLENDSAPAPAVSTSPALPQTDSTNSPSTSLTSSGQKVYSIKDGQVYLGSEIWMDEKKWDVISKSPRHSMFVKNIALGIWGTKTLKGRSVGGKFCPKFKGVKEPKPGLTPTKLDAIRNLFRDRLTSHGLEGKALRDEEGRLGRYLSEKIQDINRQPKQ